jgi:short-subunit dehydrogenase
VLRFDLERHGIKVSLVCPGGVKTGLVSTIKVAGVDAASPEFQRLRGRFSKHAVSPERAAARILRGVERDQYMVYTSVDIPIGKWFQDNFPWPYELLMRRLNRELDTVPLRAEPTEQRA